MKLIFLIQAHKNIEQLNQLIQLLHRADTSVYVHIDSKSTIDTASLDKRAKLITNRVTVFWGDFSQITATIAGLRQIQEQEQDYSHVVFLSALDYPLVSIDFMKTTLEENIDYLTYSSISPDTWNCMDRYQKYHYHADNIFEKIKVGFLRTICSIAKYKRKIYNNMSPHGGSQWFIISKPTVDYILNFLAANPGYNSFFKYVSCADELFFQTLLMNSPRKKHVVNNNYRCIIFIGTNKNPETLTLSHLNQINQSNAFFCRKIEYPQSEALVNKLKEKFN